MAKSYTLFKLKYSKPDPFVAPTVGHQPAFYGLVWIPFRRDTLYYSAPILEEIMYNIDLEYDRRGYSRYKWYIHKGNGDKQQFSPRQYGSSNSLAASPVSKLNNYVRDIQTAIEGLVNDPMYPDSLGSFFARNFGNSVLAGTYSWTKANRLPNTVTIDVKGGKVSFSPVGRAAGGQWPFPASKLDTGPDSDASKAIMSIVPRVGKDLIGNVFVKDNTHNKDNPDLWGEGFIDESKDADKFRADKIPKSQIGEQREEANVEIQEGKLVRVDPKKGKTVIGFDGVQIPMKPEGRPVANRSMEYSTLFGPVTKPEMDAGIAPLSHHPLIVQQLRYTPPIVENFDGPERVSPANYTQNLWSNQTVNINYVLSQPVERLWFFNWGNWLVKGQASSSAGGLRLGINPAQFAGQLYPNCPYALFYPPPESHCSTLYGDWSYAVWGSNDIPSLLWERQEVWQGGSLGASPKFCGPRTRMAIEYDWVPTNPSFGGYDSVFYGRIFEVAVRISLFGDQRNQAFFPIYIDPRSNTANTGPADSLNFMKSWTAANRSGGLGGGYSICVVDAINALWGPNGFIASMPKAATKLHVLSIMIMIGISGDGRKTCPAEAYRIVYGPGAIDAGMRVSLSCVASMSASPGSSDSSIRRIYFYEPPLEGAADPRLPQGS